MTLINRLFLRYARHLLREIEQSRKDPVPYQRECFLRLLSCGRQTAFGREHGFGTIGSVREFQQRIPIRDYDALAPYILRERQGEKNVLWNQPVRWFARSSGTSSDKSKFIPITPDSLYSNHYGGFKRMMASYLSQYPESGLFYGRSLTLGGSVQPDEAGGAYCGDLSAILLKNSPPLAELFRSPRRSTALIADFDRKIEAICRESSRRCITNFAGVPSWNLILMNRMLEYTGKNNLLEVWPHLELFMHGGIGFDPYRELYRQLIPSPQMHYLENYNASEGYFAFQDDPAVQAMLLTVNNGIFYEFIPMDRLEEALSGEFREIPTLEEVRTDTHYALVISTCGGLWRYLIGDCIRFVSLRPHRIRITGRTKLFINAFGEELMIENAEKALAEACRRCSCSVTDFTVAPAFMTREHIKGYHRWAVEFSLPPQDTEQFAEELDRALARNNSDYEAKRANNATMERLRLHPLPPGTFYRWMQERNRIGGQHKVPRLWNDTGFIDRLCEIGRKEE